MSIFGALLTAVGGLDANSSALSATSSNIANASTTAYKAADTAFSTLLAASQGTGSANTVGVKATTTQTVTNQGLFTTTSSNTDLAISGDGFFITSTTADADGTIEYTRAGDFTTDNDGNLKNSSGLYLLGWVIASDGSVPTDVNELTLINVESLSGTAEATTTVTLSSNLQSSTVADATYTAGSIDAGTYTGTADYATTVEIVDSQGGSQQLTISYVKTAANVWQYEISYAGDASNMNGGTTLLSTGTLNFNSDGTLDTVAATDSGATTVEAGTGNATFTIDFNNGLSDQAITIDFGTLDLSDGVTQFDTTSSGTYTKDGAVYGDVTGVSIDSDGIVSATFSNGLSKAVYQIPLATFSNPDGLKSVSGNAYIATLDSGTAVISAANTGGSGTINSKQLEDSNVDLATELTDLITTQRAYSACAKIVTTSSTMLDDLLNTVR